MFPPRDIDSRTPQSDVPTSVSSSQMCAFVSGADRRDSRRMRKNWWRWMSVVAVALALMTGCQENMAQNNSPDQKRDINAVLRDHDKELLAIPGVVGVYVTLLEDGKTPCLKVMLARDSVETTRALPKTLEGYPVVVEVTGEIRPLGNP
jgi:hypothetical protein